MTQLNVYVVTADQALKRALIGRLQRDPDLTLPAHDGTFDELESGDLVLTTPADCSSALARQLATAGVKVVVLAPVSREDARARYEGAGAAYVPIAVDTDGLFAAIRRFPHPPPIIPLAG